MLNATRASLRQADRKLSVPARCLSRPMCFCVSDLPVRGRFVLKSRVGGSRADCKPGSIRANSVFRCEYETTSNDTARSRATVP